MVVSDDKKHVGEAFSKDANNSSSKSADWNIIDENPYRSKEGVRAFRELYTGKRSKDRKAWSDYFVSDGFLEGYQKKPFLELLWNIVKNNQAIYPPSKEFVMELMIAYSLKSLEDAKQAAYFRGLEYVLEILHMGPKVTRFKEHDKAMMEGFKDYRELLMLVVSDWGDDEYLYLGKLLDYYQLSNLSDRPMRDAQTYELTQRHPRSLKLITYFFAHEVLPARAYRMAWNHLWLYNATLGKEKLFYGALRETIICKVPELAHMPRVSYKELLREFYAYDSSSGYFSNRGQTEAERARMDLFFQEPELKNALYDEIFVEEQVLHYWITKGSGLYLLKKLRSFYQEHTEAPFAKTVIDKINLFLDDQIVEIEYAEDEKSEFVRGDFDLHKRAYVRYYLNTAFHLAYDPKQKIFLQEFLANRMPTSTSWNHALCERIGGGWTPDQTIDLEFGFHMLSVSFYPKHLHYTWDGKRTVPSFPGLELLEIKDELWFWLLLPIASAAPEEYDTIYKEIVERMSCLPVHKEDIPTIAGCITSWICRFEDYDVPLFTFYEEIKEHLFGCNIYGNNVIKLFEETELGQQLLPSGTHHAQDIQAAIEMGEQLLHALLTDYWADVTIELYPSEILLTDRWGTLSTFRGKITRQAIRELVEQYFEGMIKRLELAWGIGSLIFIRDGKQYACFYFDHAKQDWYRLVALPDVYAWVDSDDVEYEPFLNGMLPNYLIHHSPRLIQEQLRDIFAQVACANPYPKMMMWSPEVYRFETRQQYRLAKYQFGGYPLEESENQIMDRFYMPKIPAVVCFTDGDGKESGRVDVGKDKAMVQRMLSDYLAGRLQELILAWQYEREKFHYRYLILQQDGDKAMMIYLDDSLKGMDYLVADVGEYLDADEKKYRKEQFRGRTVPGYLVHRDKRRIRNYLDCLIPQMKEVMVNLGEFGEFSYCCDGEYEWLREEVVRKGLG